MIVNKQHISGLGWTYLFKSIFDWIELQDYNSARIGANHNVIYQEKYNVSVTFTMGTVMCCINYVYLIGNNMALPLFPPVSLKGMRDLISPNISMAWSVYTLPVFGSGLSISRTLPLPTHISCCLVPQKLPCTACIIEVDRCSVKLYRCMTAH